MRESQRPKVAIVADNEELQKEVIRVLENEFDLCPFSNGILLYHDLQQGNRKFAFIVSVSDYRDVMGFPLKKTIDNLGFAHLPFFLVTRSISKELILEFLKKGITDVFPIPIQEEGMRFRLQFYLKHPVTSENKKKNPLLKEFKMPWAKRVFDVLASGLALLVLTPLFLIVTFDKNGVQRSSFLFFIPGGHGV